MENKTFAGWHLESNWKSALADLDQYLDLIPVSAMPNPAVEVGMVGIGLHVRFYCRQNWGSTKDYPGAINSLSLSTLLALSTFSLLSFDFLLPANCFPLILDEKST
jgi:hypothetical protein